MQYMYLNSLFLVKYDIFIFISKYFKLKILFYVIVLNEYMAQVMIFLLSVVTYIYYYSSILLMHAVK